MAELDCIDAQRRARAHARDCDMPLKITDHLRGPIGSDIRLKLERQAEQGPAGDGDQLLIDTYAAWFGTEPRATWPARLREIRAELAKELVAPADQREQLLNQVVRAIERLARR